MPSSVTPSCVADCVEVVQQSYSRRSMASGKMQSEIAVVGFRRAQLLINRLITSNLSSHIMYDKRLKQFQQGSLDSVVNLFATRLSIDARRSHGPMAEGILNRGEASVGRNHGKAE